MPELNIEAVVDKLLVFMVDEMEAQGSTTNTTRYNFEPDREDRIAFVTKYPELEPMLVQALNVCLSRRLVEHKALGSQYDYLGLSTAGQARGLSVKHKRPDQPTQPTFNIGVLTSHGPMQIGNGNTMSIEAFQAAALAGIEAADAPQEQKAEAKSLLAKVLEHPLLSSVLGGIAGGVTSGLTGRGLIP